MSVKNIYANKTVIVTGAASGIGLALSTELIKRGAKVWLSDISYSQAQAGAAQLGKNAHAVALDVRDAVAVQKLVDQIVAENAELNFMFNNAGIGMGGEMHALGVSHFDKIIDINIRGVMNSVAASYPVMVKQGHGCIVNTASAAGLGGVPLMAPYAMTKHAIVGLSKSLRIEGEHYGVQVNALCPSAIETPLLDANMAAGDEQIWRPDVRGFLSKFAPPYPVQEFAIYALDQIAANKAIIVAPRQTRVVMFLARLFPGLLDRRLKRLHLQELKNRQD
ncbi:MAG: NAD(P)-dependent dehydrogenase (short-subunit alcohol dehydrogenase family) [Arenicella sp.]|jgi:NAD(P)-dependent dehydrogenase (short-subunit alcohol dehydrogenase family)